MPGQTTVITYLGSQLSSLLVIQNLGGETVSITKLKELMTNLILTELNTNDLEGIFCGNDMGLNCALPSGIG